MLPLAPLISLLAPFDSLRLAFGVRWLACGSLWRRFGIHFLIFHAFPALIHLFYDRFLGIFWTEHFFNDLTFSLDM